jgi:hypothetical protein
MEFADLGNLDAKMAFIKGKILALAWMMPPLVFPRSLQVSRALKALSQLGWETSVVTILPEAEPHATLDPKLEDLYEGCYRRIFVNPREDMQRSPLWLRLWRKFTRHENVLIDNWLRRAGKKLCEEVKHGHYSALVTFAQPWVDHLVGLEIKRQFPNLPWLVHFSDPWVDSPYFDLSDPVLVKRAHRQERNVINGADIVIFVNQRTADLVMAKYPESWRSKVRIVPHGYDLDILDVIAANTAPSEKMRIVYSGNFYALRNPGIFLQAVAKLVEDAEIKSLLQIEFVGYAGEEFETLATELGLAECVLFRGKGKYLASLEIAASADLLLILDAPAKNSVFLPSKIVDYLMLRKPILGVTPSSGATADVLRALDYPIVPPDDAQNIANELRKLFQCWRLGHLAVPFDIQTKEFDIRETTIELEKALIQAIENNGALVSED